MCAPVCELNETLNNIILFINILNILKIMDKKELKFYEAPASEVVELKLQGMLCASGDEPEPTDGGSEEIPSDKIQPGFFD